MGRLFYTYVSDQYAPFSSKVVNVGVPRSAGNTSTSLVITTGTRRRSSVPISSGRCAFEFRIWVSRLNVLKIPFLGRTSKGWFFGFKRYVLRSIQGRIVNLVLTPGNWDDRAPVPALLEAVNGGVMLGDLCYRGKQRAEEWAEEAAMFILTRADTPEKKYLLAQVR